MHLNTVVESIATANPPFRGRQEEAAGFMQKVESLSAAVRKRIPKIYGNSAIEYRYSCVQDYLRDAPEFDFFPRDWSLTPAPTTAERNKRYRAAVIPMAETAARRALDEARILPEEITHVIVVSCTGFFAPGLDIELVKRLGLPAGTRRTLIGFMGCYAAFNALRVAHSFCQSNPNARVLVVCAELCTLHFQVENSLESTIVNALFSDGAAAVILSSRSNEEASGQLAYRDTQAFLDSNSMEDMTWDIGDTGFIMGLTPRVPEIIARSLPDVLNGLLTRNSLQKENIDFWAIHPGGRSIVEKARETLDLPDHAVFDSLEVLRLYGNMSSPTILFILERILTRHRHERRDGRAGFSNGLAMAFGPGLTIESALFQRID